MGIIQPGWEERDATKRKSQPHIIKLPNMSYNLKFLLQISRKKKKKRLKRSYPGKHVIKVNMLPFPCFQVD